MSWLMQLLDKNSPNPSIRLELSEQLISQLSHNRLPTDSKALNTLCDVVFQWMSASNFKVSLQAIEVLNTALDISGDILAPYLLERSSALVERLGDSKPQVRDSTTNLLIDLSNTPHCSHQVVLDKISIGFSHKQTNIKCGTMNVFRLLLDEGREELESQTTRLVPLLCKLMVDPNNDVRETSMNTVVHVMIVLGEDVAVNIRNRRLIPDAKMQLLMQRYEEALRKGSVPSAVSRPIRVQRRFEPRAQSAVATSRNGSNGSLRDEQENIGARRPIMMVKKPVSTPSRTPVVAGVVTEEEIRRNFRDVPKITISNRNDIRTYLEEARIVLERTDIDWSKRNNSLKMVRAVVQNGGMDFDSDLITNLLQLEEALVKSVTDLRSQVCKEACITVCLLSERLGTKLSPLFERILPQCVPIIQNSAKVMSSSSQQACDFIVKNVQSPRILQAILDQTSHKSKDIRAHCHYLVYLALQNWPQLKLEKQVKELTNAVKSAINDADPKARKNGRDSYLQLEIVFPSHAQALFKTLDPSKQKTLSGGASAASSAQSIHSLRDGMPFTKRPGTTGLSRPSAFLSGRSASAIDTSSAKLAAVSSPRYNANRMPVTPSRPGGTLRGSMTSSVIKTRPSVTPLRSNLANSSQPSSRNGSPTRLHKRLPPQAAPPRPSAVTPTSHNNGFHQEDSEELFSKISNLTLQATFGEDEDFLLGSSPSSQLTAALKKSSSNDATEKKDGLRMLYDILRTSRSSEADIKKIYDALMKYIMEGNLKLLSLVCDTVCEMVTRYPDSFATPQLLTLVNRLISKSSSELIPTNQTIWRRMLTEVRTSFHPDDLLVAICKFIDGSMAAPQTTKAKSQTVQYLCELVTQMEAGSNINRLEVKCALEKIFVWLEDPKNHDIRPHFEKLMAALFNTNQAQFASMLSSFKPEWKNLGFQLCQKDSQRKESIEFSPIVRESPSVFSGIDMADNFRRNQSPSLGPFLNNSVESEGNRSNLDVTAHLGSDTVQQIAYIKKQLNELAMAKSNPQRQDEQILAMQQLLQMITEGSFTTWDDNFKPLIVQLFDLLTLDDIKVKKEALRLLIRLCTVQASRFYDYGQMTVTKVLATTFNEKDNYFLNVVDECLKTLAIHLPIPLTLATLNPIIATKSDPRITFALKMIQRMIEEWKHDDLQNYLPEFVPGVIQCYNCEDSSIRKNTIFCLVPLVNKFGREVMGQYLIRLESKGQKLLDVYLTRTQTASTHF